MRIKAFILAITLALVGASIAGSSGAATPPEHGFVTASITVPVNANEARALGRDLTGDGKADNALATVLAALTQQGVDFTQGWNADVHSGRIVMLQSLRSTSLATDRHATWQLLYGVPVTNPNLTGTGTFTAGPTHSARVAARIVAHRVSTTATTLPIRMDLGSGPFSMPMVVGRAFETCYSRCTGARINGAVRVSAISSIFIPQLAHVLQKIVDRDCPGPGPDTCTSQSSGASIEQIFDTNQDLVISADELRNSNLIKALLAPDVDLYRADGTRGTDGKPDSISFGFGFVAVKARIIH